MTKYIKFFVAVLLSWLSNQSAAGTTSDGPITATYFLTNGILLIHANAVYSNAPSCATQGVRFALNGTTPGGKIQAAAILAALSAGKNVAFWGNGQCSIWGDTETLDFFIVRSN